MSVDSLWRHLDLVNDWVRFADAKAAAVLTADSVLFGVLALRGFNDRPSSSLSWAATVAGVAAATASFVVGILVVLPRGSRVGVRHSLLYFGDVAVDYPGQPGAFIAQVQQLSENPTLLADALASQVWANSVIAAVKYRRVGWSISLLFVATLLTGLSMVTAWAGG